MIRIGTIKSVFLVALGILAIALVGSAAGDTMGQCDSMMQSGRGDYQGNDTMMRCMTGEYLANGSCYMAKMDQDESAAQSKLDYTDYWLEKAMVLHKLHMDDPSKATSESKKELMNCMMCARECVMGENVTMEMMDNMTAHKKASAISMYAAQNRLNNADFWLKQALVLHKIHMEDSSKATNESQMEMMGRMMYARKCIMGESEAMEMTDKVRMDSAGLWLKKAMVLHKLHMNDPSTETNESKMEMMGHMMRAYEYMTGENMTMEMMDKAMKSRSLGEYEKGC